MERCDIDLSPGTCTDPERVDAGSNWKVLPEAFDELAVVTLNP
jgi:hypothetical protein